MATKQKQRSIWKRPRGPEFKAWDHMIQRCTNPNDPGYKHYGGRGLTVCERWRHFRNFFGDMGPRPGNKNPTRRSRYSIERIDNNGNYEPGNCRWATQKQQMRNTRVNLELVTHDGKTMCLTDWAAETGIPYKRLYIRYTRLGWTFKDAIETPKYGKRPIQVTS